MELPLHQFFTQQVNSVETGVEFVQVKVLNFTIVVSNQITRVEPIKEKFTIEKDLYLIAKLVDIEELYLIEKMEPTMESSIIKMVSSPKAVVKFVLVMILNFTTEVLCQITKMELYPIMMKEPIVELYPIMMEEPIVESSTIMVKENLMVLDFVKAEVITMLDFTID